MVVTTIQFYVSKHVTTIQFYLSKHVTTIQFYVSLLAHGRWFSPGISASSTTKTSHHDIAEILLEVALNTINQIKSNHMLETFFL
jgi:hypothetical protein